MASVNKAIIVGNLGKDPEVRYTPSGKAVCKFPIATTEKWGDGENEKHTEWHNVVAWNKLGELCGQYLAKGRQAYIEGTIRSHSYDDKEGNKRYVTEIIAQQVKFLGGKHEEARGEGDSGFDGSMPMGKGDVPF